MVNFSNVIPFRENRPLKIMLVWLAAVWLWAAIEPLNRLDWALENLLVFVFGAILVISYKHFAFSNGAYLLFTLFMTLHLVGSHYTYVNVPFGFWLQESFDLQRNHYDRLVHFCYGFLLATPFKELFIRLADISTRWATFFTVNCILAFSAFFEVIEAWIAMVVEPELGHAYLGTQGDIWDAQHDMILAFIGSIIALTIQSIWHKSRNN